MYRKNTASQFLTFQLINASTGAGLTGATVSVRRCIDGTFAAATGTVTEDTGAGSSAGFYKLALSQGDTNGNDIGFAFTATSAIPVVINIVTTACDPTSTAFGLSLAKTTNITGFNDITAAAAATGVWQDTTAGDFTVELSVGKSLMNGISLGTGLTVNALTNLPSIPNNWLTAAGIAASALNGKGDWLLSSSYTTPPTTAQIATGVWTDTTAGDFTVALSVGKSVMNGVTLGTGLTINAYTGNTVQTGDSYAALTGAQSEPGQGAPAANASPLAKVSYLFKAWRNRTTQTSSQYSLYNDDAVTVDQKASFSDDGTTADRGEVATGP